jgi:hypothetical protein
VPVLAVEREFTPPVATWWDFEKGPPPRTSAVENETLYWDLLGSTGVEVGDLDIRYFRVVSRFLPRSTLTLLTSD